jgi:hypothetical protein
MQQTALHITTQVLPGNKIEVQADGLPVGETVEVFVISSTKKPQASRSATDIFNQLPGRRLFQTPDQADQYLQQERASWEA